MTTNALRDATTESSPFPELALTPMTDKNSLVTTILVADDDDDIRDLIAFKLQMAGYRVLAADNGCSALSIVKSELPDAIVLDIGMPGLDGFDVCYQLQGLRATVGIPVIIVSARTSRLDVDLGLAIGADDYVTKPFSPADLVRRVRWALMASGH
jgi:DNA-binding response OmpR family regulator